MPNQPDSSQERDASYSRKVSAYESLVRLMLGDLPDESRVARYLAQLPISSFRGPAKTEPTETRIDLATYLERLSRCLAPLPKKLRTDDMAEITQHLSSAISESIAQGYSEEAAEAHVLTQFGSSQDVGSSIVGAWRTETLSRNRVAFAVTFAFVAFAASLDTLQNPRHFPFDGVAFNWIVMAVS